jgi:ribonuclease PH
VDLNVGITSKGEFVEIQGTGEGRPFPPSELQNLLDVAQKGAQDTIAICREALKKANISIPI